MSKFISPSSPIENVSLLSHTSVDLIGKWPKYFVYKQTDDLSTACQILFQSTAATRGS
jgi:hypothetical protein